MLDINDFTKKQILLYSPVKGDKLAYQNDNLIIKDGNGVTKYQCTCYQIFMIIIVGDTTITTGLLRRAQKFGFAICFTTITFKLYAVFDTGIQGNVLLHRKQYTYDQTEIARIIIKNKIGNQREALNRIRRKTQDIKEGIALLDGYVEKLKSNYMRREEIVGIEGSAAKVYFSRVFNNVQWKGRKPRIKFDYVNCLLDLVYNLLFNFVDAILQVFGFDTYCGVLHTCFYMRKSLVCDIIEPFRPIIDWKIRTGINLEQFCEKDFVKIKDQWQLEFKKSSHYVAILLEEILAYKDAIFLYIRGYYRAFMKDKKAEEFPIFCFADNKTIYSCTEGRNAIDNSEL